MIAQEVPTGPVQMLEEIDDFAKEVVDPHDYDQEEVGFNPTSAAKKEEEFRNYENSARQRRVQDFYKTQHQSQTVEFVKSMRERHLKLDKFEMGIWEALEYLDSVVDDSDPDTNLTQLQHALQTAEAIRKAFPDPKYDWFHLVGLIHDLGKILAVNDASMNLHGDPQWAIVGDTFPVGCAFEKESNIFPQFFDENPDSSNQDYNTKLGMYEQHCGLSYVLFSWGHDEYLYQVLVRNGCSIPEEGLYMVRFHSFYPWHRANGYDHLMDDKDRSMLKWVKEMNRFDLYSKSDGLPELKELKTYYCGLIDKYCPGKLRW